MSRRRSIVSGWILLGLFFLFWSALTSIGDGAAVHNLVLQWRATGYPTTTGVVQESSAVSRGGMGNGCHVQVRYTYELNGQPLTGTRYRYGLERNSRQDIARILTTLTPGSEITVHYNPRDPTDAVLVSGIQSGDLFFFHFLMPFNCAMLLGWIALARAIWCWKTGPPAGYARVTERGSRTWVDFCADRFWTARQMVLGVLTFVTIFAVGFPFGFNPPWLVLVFAWLLIVVGVIVLAPGLASAIAEQVLIVDLGSRILELHPPGALHKTDARPIALIPFATVTQILVERLPADNYYGWVDVPTLHIRRDDGQCETHQLVQWQNAPAAQWLADWLRQRILVEPATPQAVT